MVIKLNRRLILASKSPRRLELFHQVGLNPEVIPADIDETGPDSLNPEELTAYIADKKTMAVAEAIDDGIIIGADTIVVFNGEIFPKPADSNDASAMLQKLSGNTHNVITAFCIIDKPSGNKICEIAKTNVTFKELSHREISDYILSGEPLDKAGAYGIQEEAALFVDKIEGCYFNVMGFPLSLFYRTITRPENIEKLSLI